MKKVYAVLIAVAVSLGIAVISAPAANAYLVYQGVWDESVHATIPAAHTGVHCWNVGAANGGYFCETIRGGATWPQENFTNLHNYIHTTQRGLNAILNDNSWICYNRGRPPGTVNTLYTCFQDA